MACEKGVLPLLFLVGRPREEEDEEEVDCEDCWDRGTTGVLPPRSTADEAEEEALPCTSTDFLGIRGGCRVFWTRASLEAECILVRAVSSKGGGKSEAVDGKMHDVKVRPLPPGTWSERPVGVNLGAKAPDFPGLRHLGHPGTQELSNQRASIV